MTRARGESNKLERESLLSILYRLRNIIGFYLLLLLNGILKDKIALLLTLSLMTNVSFQHQL